MTKTATVLLFCFFMTMGTSCRIFHSRPRAPAPPSTPTLTETVTAEPQKGQENAEDAEEKSEKEIAKENRKRIKTKTQITEEIDSFRNELKKIEVTFANKRAEGINTSKAEEIFKNSSNLLKEAERLYLEANLTENYEPVLGLLQAIEDSFEKIKEEIKKAPRFREKTKPKPREYMDDRDIIFEKMGHPNPINVRVGPATSFSFQIHDGTSMLLNVAECFSPFSTGGTSDDSDEEQPPQSGRRTQPRISGIFHLGTPPKIMIIEYYTGQEGTYQFVLAEDDPNLNLFIFDQYLKPDARDRALGSMCQSQGAGFENYRLIASYKNKMAGTPEEVLEQLLSGRFRFADQFGLGALTENAKGGATLADLELVSLVFSIKIEPLSRKWSGTLDKIHEKIKDDLPSNEKLQKAFAKINSWQNSFSPKKGDKKDFLNLITNRQDRQEIEALVNEFEDTLNQLVKEFERVQKELLQFKKSYGVELVFYDDQNPVIIFLLRGVGFKVEEASAGTLFKKDVLQLLVKQEFLYYRSKNDEQPLLVLENQFKIENANKYIDVANDYQRLTSFMLGWPLRDHLTAGHYQLKLTITDEIRERAVIQEIDFMVLSASLREKGGY